MHELVLTRPDDWHTHLRDGAALATTVPHTARQFARAIVMPNLAPPVTTLEQADAYRERICAHIPRGGTFTPLMTLYLTDATTPETLIGAAASGRIAAVKLYPAGATTHSSAGVTSMERIQPALAAMEEMDLPLLVHGEVTDGTVDIFDREKVFIERCLEPLAVRFPALRVVFEHITTADAVEFVRAAPHTIAATITPQHLLLNRNDLLTGGIHPHHYCLPVLKREHHRRALMEAAASGHPRFFLGTDSAPHEQGRKESACGCAGIYSAHAALPLYAEAFEAAGALDKLEGFCALHGAAFYRLPVNTERVRLVREPWTVPDSYPLGDGKVIPLRAGAALNWRLGHEH